MNLRTSTLEQIERIERCGAPEEGFRLARALAGSPDQWGRIEAIRFLLRYGNAESVDLLAIALNDRILLVAQAAAEALAAINTEQALTVLATAFRASTEANPDHLAHALSHFGEAGLALLIEFTRVGTADQRLSAVKHLAAYKGSPAAIAALQVALGDQALNRDGASVAVAAKRALRKNES